jgi:hypothetical protein
MEAVGLINRSIINNATARGEINERSVITIKGLKRVSLSKSVIV